MRSRYKLSTVSGLLLAMGTVLGTASGRAEAAQFIQNPAAVCVPASKVGIDLRNRPLAVQNEGATSIFVNCSFTTMGHFFGGAERNPTEVHMFFSVNDGEADSISCTAILGFKSDPTPIVKVTKIVDLPATGDEIGLSWLPVDFGEATVMPSGLFNVQCALNPGVGINDSYVFFNE